MISAPTSRSMEDEIREAIRRRIAQILAEETEKAVAESRRRIAAVADELTLSLLRYYEIRGGKDHILIEVKKP
jgi:uncharacterized protein (UPF0218 family)